MTDLTAGQLASLACLREVTASKPGNIHRGADFEDASFEDFVTSSILLGQAIDSARDVTVGRQILNAVQATQTIIGNNTNLGIVLLLVPLARAYSLRSSKTPFGRQLLASVLIELTPEDCHQVYAAIKTANPGGLGKTSSADVGLEPPDDLVRAMCLAADRDRVAAQYANDFEDVFEFVVPTLQRNYQIAGDLTYAIILTHLEILTKFPDSLIARKCGQETAQLASSKAQTIMQLWTDRTHGPTEEFWNQVADFDFWLRSDGHRRNPGTTADLIAAGIFAAMASGALPIHGPNPID